MLQKFADVVAALVHVAWYAIVGVAAMVTLFELVVHHGLLPGLCR